MKKNMTQNKKDGHQNTHIAKKIATNRNRMIVVVGGTTALAIWQRDFVIHAMMSHLEMNLTIFATFVFSIVLAFIFVFKLNNEVVAFSALREMWEDIRVGEEKNAQDPLWRHYRCMQPAIVFSKPRLLGHAYELVTQEMSRTKDIRISVETMNTLVHSVEQAINEEKSTVMYLSGLMVFLGLIGTFTGLLQMVASIGGIISSLASSAGGGAAAGAFQELLAALQEPLRGMATGFATSLFGLFGSLTIGLLGRYAGQAANVLKHEFEAWLAGVVRFNADGGHKDNNKTATNMSPNAAFGEALPSGAMAEPALLNMVSNILKDYARVNDHFEQIAKSMKNLQNGQVHQDENLRQVLHRFMEHDFAGGQANPQGETSGAAIEAALQGLTRQVETIGLQFTHRLERDIEKFQDVIGEIGHSHAQGMRLLASNQAQSASQLVGIVEQISGEMGRRSLSTSSEKFEIATERGLEKLGHLLDNQSSRMEQSITHLSEGQKNLLQIIGRRSEINNSGQEGVEHLLAEHLGRLNQIVDTVLASQSGVLHVALAALERTNAPIKLQDEYVEPTKTTTREYAPPPASSGAAPAPRISAEGGLRAGASLDDALNEMRAALSSRR